MNSIRVTNDLGESLTIELARPELSGFAVLYIDGLGPPKANIVMTERSNIDGSLYNSAKAEFRNVMLAFKFYHTHDIAETRRRAYQYFPLKRQIKLEIFAGDREAHAYGYVESNEPNIFSKNAGCTISILFPDSYLYALSQTIIAFSSITPLFEFPFSNESLVADLIELSESNLETTKNVVYEGDAPIGMLWHIHANGAASGVSITDARTLLSLEIDSTKYAAIVGTDIVLGDDIYISTVVGNKYAIAIRSSTTYNILSCLGSSPPWFQLQRGDNLYAYDATSGLTNLEFDVTFDVAFEGI